MVACILEDPSADEAIVRTLISCRPLPVPTPRTRSKEGIIFPPSLNMFAMTSAVVSPTKEDIVFSTSEILRKALLVATKWSFLGITAAILFTELIQEKTGSCMEARPKALIIKWRRNNKPCEIIKVTIGRISPIYQNIFIRSWIK